MSTKANTAPTTPAPTSSILQEFASSSEEIRQHVIEPQPNESQKVKDEHIQVFCREYAKRIAAATSSKKAGGLSEDRKTDQIIWPTRDALMELYKKLLRDSKDPKIREVLSDQSFAVSSFATSLAEKLEQQLGSGRQQQLPNQKLQCSSCGKHHGDQDPLEFPHDSYEDEPLGFDSEDCNHDDDDDEDEDEDENDDDIDDEDNDDEDDDDDDYDDDDDDSDDDDGSDEDDEDDMDSCGEDEDFEDDSDEDMTPRFHHPYFPHHYARKHLPEYNPEEERRMFVSISQIHNDDNILEEGIRKKQLFDAQKKKQEGERIRLLQRLRLEDEERRKKEQQGKERKERQEQEQRKRREANEADQAARSFLFTSTSKSRIEVVKSIMEASPDSRSIAGVPKFATASAIRLAGWEYISEDVNGKGANEKSGLQETLLHVAARTGCLDLVLYFIGKGAPLDVLDSEGGIPLHSAAKHNAPLDVCRLLIEKAPYSVDWHGVKSGKTALHHAAQNGNGELVALLLQNHARVSAVDAEGNTPEMLAKAGLEREKSTKSKAQKYRSAIHHIQKYLTAIKEAQRQKDAQLEKQRKKEEELAKEEAEKDMAARKKQEEKLEADQRRREEEERELERLKALALDPHNQATGGTGNKKKKKKRGKATNDAHVTPKEATPMPASVPPQDLVAKSASPSPLNSPAPTQSSPLPRTPYFQTAEHKPDGIPLSTSLSPKDQTSTVNPDTDLRTISVSAKASHLPALSNIRSPTTKASKTKTNYRPSQLVVTRMTDMGFPQHAARKALIQTEGKVEEAIELLTSGAALGGDSEDEVEMPTQQAALRKVVRDPVLISPTTKQEMTTKAPTLKSTTQPSQSTPNIQPSDPLKPQHPKANISTSTKKPITHPIQILNRPTVLPPHVQMRAVPTQVLQRPPPQSRSNTNNTPLKSITVRVPTSIQAPARYTSNSDMPPPHTQRALSFPPPAIIQHSSTQYPTQGQLYPTPHGSSIPLSNHQTTTPQLAGSNSLHSISDLNVNISSPPNLSQQNMGSNIISHGTHALSSVGSSTGWDRRPTGQGSSPFGAMHDHQMGISNMSTVIDNSPWGMITSVETTSVSESRASSFNYQPSSLAIPRFPSLSLSTTDITERLRQSQADMDDDADSDMIKDILAMAGAIDRDELGGAFSDFPMSDVDDRGSRASSKPSVAVGEGRAQTSPRNPVSSLWEYGSFTQEIPNISQSWSSSQPQKDFGIRTRSDGSIAQGYDNWNHDLRLEESSMRPLSYQDSYPHASNIGQHTHTTSYINNLFGASNAHRVGILPVATTSTDDYQAHNTKPGSVNNNYQLESNLQQFGYIETQGGAATRNFEHEATQGLLSDEHHPSYLKEQNSRFYSGLQQTALPRSLESTASAISTSILPKNTLSRSSLDSSRPSTVFSGGRSINYKFDPTIGASIRGGQSTRQDPNLTDSSQFPGLDSPLANPTLPPSLDPNIASEF
ncbi:hypothetical protein BGZ76_001946 [Entomortierella beljakovae]|nr:hypothetical protein BGZ76_001946 [Entomortierella beljakovae]